MIEYIHGDLTELTPAMAVVETAGVKITTLEALKERALKTIGNPAPLPFGDKVVGVVMNRDGSVMDVIKNIKA